VVAVSDRDHVEAGLHLAPEVRSGKGRGGNDGVRQQSPAGKHPSSRRKFGVEKAEVETMVSVNKVLLENILPAHVADHFLISPHRQEVAAVSCSLPRDATLAL